MGNVQFLNLHVGNRDIISYLYLDNQNKNAFLIAWWSYKLSCSTILFVVLKMRVDLKLKLRRFMNTKAEYVVLDKECVSKGL